MNNIDEIEIGTQFYYFENWSYITFPIIDDIFKLRANNYLITTGFHIHNGQFPKDSPIVMVKIELSKLGIKTISLVKADRPFLVVAKQEPNLIKILQNNLGWMSITGRESSMKKYSPATKSV